MGVTERFISRIGKHFGFDAQYVARSGVWLNARILWSTLLTLGVSVAFANLITPEQYGIYKFIIAATTFWGTLFLTGANIAVTRSVARGLEGTLSAAVHLQFRWDIVGAIGIAGTGTYYIISGNTAVGIPILAASVLYPLASIFNTYIALFAGRQDFKNQSLLESFTTAIYAVVLLAGLLLGASPGLLAVLFFFSNAAGHAIGFWRARRSIPLSATSDSAALTYAQQLSLIGIPSGFVLQLDNILVFHFLGSAELAIYSFAVLGPDKISSLLKFIPTIAFPRFARRSMTQLRESVVQRAIQFSVIATGIALVYILSAPTIFRWVFPQYILAVPYTQIYALSLIATGAALVSHSLLSQQRTRRIAILQIGMPVVQLIVTFIGIRYFGLWGAISAKLAGDFISFGLTSFVHQYSRTTET